MNRDAARIKAAEAAVALLRNANGRSGSPVAYGRRSRAQTADNSAGFTKRCC